jgi:hypothetical protein
MAGAPSVARWFGGSRRSVGVQAVAPGTFQLKRGQMRMTPPGRCQVRRRGPPAAHPLWKTPPPSTEKSSHSDMDRFWRAEWRRSGTTPGDSPSRRSYAVRRTAGCRATSRVLRARLLPSSGHPERRNFAPYIPSTRCDP